MPHSRFSANRMGGSHAFVFILLLAYVASLSLSANHTQLQDKNIAYNVIPRIYCKTCVVEQQKYLLDSGYDSIYIVAPFELDSLQARLKARHFVRSLKSMFPQAAVSVCSEEQRLVVRNLLNDSTTSGVLIVDYGSTRSTFITYDSIKGRTE